MGTYTERARALRPFIIKAAASLSDADALQAKELYARWAAGMVVEPGDRLVHAVDCVDKLFRVNEGKGHTTQKGWEPDKTPALFTVINETNAGTKEDPIPASRGMEYTYGLYYTDPEDSKLYLCERTGSTAGDKITLQYLPHELVGQYFSSVE